MADSNDPRARRWLPLLLLALGWLSLPTSPVLATLLPGEGDLSEPQRRVLEAWTSARTPGEAHDHLLRRVGEWDLTTRTWSEGSVEPQVSRATARRRMVLGGRYLEERVEAEVLDAPFQGFGVTGYDNVTRRWWSTWIDTMSTAPVHTVSRPTPAAEAGEGSRGAAGELAAGGGEAVLPTQPETLELETELIVMTGSYVDPLSGESREVRTVTRVLDEDREIFEWWEVRPDGSERKTMEIVYQRRRGEDEPPEDSESPAGADSRADHGDPGFR